MEYRPQRKTIAATTLVWGEQFATGIEEIDEQHKVMFGRVNELLEAEGSGLSRDQVAALMTALHGHAVMHFDCEERRMESRRCSVCAANSLAHRDFLRDFVDLEEQFDREGATPEFFDQVRRRVGAWLSAHIMAIDIALRETVNRGVPPKR